MKNKFNGIISITFILILFLVLNFVLKNDAAAENTGSVSLSGTVQQYISLSISEGDSIAFGNISPGVPQCSAGSGTIVGVTTSASNGYTLSLSDDSDTNSPMVHTDGVNYIPDMTAPLSAPTSWVTGTTKGLAVTMYAADSTKSVIWGTGTTACDANNNWAGVPAVAATAHDVSGYHAGVDTSSWGWKVDVINTQKTGTYSGSVLFTSAPKLS